jgi:hypothetical protein
MSDCHSIAPVEGLYDIHSVRYVVGRMHMSRPPDNWQWLAVIGGDLAVTGSDLAMIWQ